MKPTTSFHTDYCKRIGIPWGTDGNECPRCVAYRAGWADRRRELARNLDRGFWSSWQEDGAHTVLLADGTAAPLVRLDRVLDVLARNLGGAP